MSEPVIEPVETRPVDFNPPIPVPVVTKSSRGGTVLLLAAAFVAVAGLAFAGGRFTAPAAAAAQPVTGFRGPGRSFNPGTGGPGFGGGGGGGVGGGRFFGAAGAITLRGQVTAVSADSITLSLDNGSSLTVPLNSSTTYHQSTASSQPNVKVGDKVAIEPGPLSANPGASAAPGPSTGPSGPTTGGQFELGPAVDVTVIAN